MITLPFPWAGGKRLVAAEIWRHMGRCAVAVDPFFGGGGLLLGRPGPVPMGAVEIVNDLDGHVANFWRALQLRHQELCDWLDYPVSEVDLTARHRWLRAEGLARLEDLDFEADPLVCDPQVAAWWAWGQSQWIGGGWCGTTARRRPKTKLNGVCRRTELEPWLAQLAARLRYVQIWRGDWRRLLTDAVLSDPNGTPCAVLLDPPYDQELRHHRPSSPLYTTDTNPSADVRAWCAANGQRPLLRIALCGLDGEHDELETLGWWKMAWSARGMSNQGHDTTPNKTRRHEERVWLSPHVPRAVQLDLVTP